MTSTAEELTESDATTLCKACGLCCTGHLFAWAKLKSAELKTAAELGLDVLGSEPGKRGFNQPCPVWNGECTIYTSPHYPHFCRLYKCALLKKVMDGRVSLAEALITVEHAKKMIAEVESMLPHSENQNFRERLVHELEHGRADTQIQRRGRDLLAMYSRQFGVKGVINHLESFEENPE